MYRVQVDGIVYGRKGGGTLSLVEAVGVVRGCAGARVLRADGTVVLTQAGSTELPWVYAPTGRQIRHRLTWRARRRWQDDPHAFRRAMVWPSPDTEPVWVTRADRAEVPMRHIVRAGASHQSQWWQIAQWMHQEWIRPGDYLACVKGHGSCIAPFSLTAHGSRAAAVEQVRGNLRFYPAGWVVTIDGATRVTV